MAVERLRPLLGRREDQWWAVPALAAVLNTWALSIDEWANTHYSAAVLGMTRRWEAVRFQAEPRFLGVLGRGVGDAWACWLDHEEDLQVRWR